MLTIKRIPVNPLQENCYILSDETKEAVIIDCGAFSPAEEQTITRYIDENGLKLVHLLMTHAHYDHILGNGFIYAKYGLGGKCHSDDEKLYAQAPQMLAAMMGAQMSQPLPPLQGFLADGDTVSFGHTTLKVIHTPGHSQGGIHFYCEAEKSIFCGDSLFKGSIGRTDLPGGNYRDLVTTLAEKILTLPNDVVVYPGHGPQSSIGYEQTHNPYL